MKIKAFLRKSGLTLEEFAIIIGASVGSVFRWKHGYRPNLRTAKKIVRKTKGEVSLKDLGWKEVIEFQEVQPDGGKLESNASIADLSGKQITVDI